MLLVLLSVALGLYYATQLPAISKLFTGARRPNAVNASYVGAAACATCHATESETWRGSHHDLAMQEAREGTVLGDFRDASFTHFGVTTTFFKRDGQFMTRTDGPDGALHEYPIAWTFGVYPLQQYLIRLERGRVQALNVVWDARPKNEGGQCWFHLYPNEAVPHDDILHWTGPYQNWNHQCAECHSTNVRKGYDAASDSFNTTWSEINVSCESCHGPGSRHVAWAKQHGGTSSAGAARASERSETEAGLVYAMRDAHSAAWVMDTTTGIARRSAPRGSHAEAEMCARCHSRRSLESEDYVFGKPLLDTHRLALLEPALYHADGQILDEVYEYGSFTQSKMYAAGVGCTDCHEPHGMKTRASGNALCASCHLPARFDTPEHHHHPANSAGAQCISCHMPTRDYMVIHTRHDHSLRVPRPDLSQKLGTPNACNQCHTAKSTQWAADAALRWWGPKRREQPHYGEVLHAGRLGEPGAGPRLAQLAADPLQPSIVRATALSLLPDNPGATSIPTLVRGLADPDPVLREASVEALDEEQPAQRAVDLGPLLNDGVRLVRMSAARALAGLPQTSMSPKEQQALAAGLKEYRAARALNADRAESHMNLGNLERDLGHFADAEREYRKAIAITPQVPSFYVNLADLLSQDGRGAEGEQVLRQGLAIEPEDADLHHALGLLLIREKRPAEALPEIARASALRPDDARYAYVYGVALHSAGQPQRAIEVLQRACRQHPGDRDILIALVTINRDAGATGKALEYAQQLLELNPQDRDAQQLYAGLAVAAQRPTAPR